MNPYREKAKAARIKRANKMLKMHQSGLSMREIALKLGISAARVNVLIISVRK